MRTHSLLLLLLPTLAASSARAESEPAQPPEPAAVAVATPTPVVRIAPQPASHTALWEAELRLGFGITRGGTADMAATGATPVSFAALAALAVNDEPRAFAFGGLVGEAVKRSSVGVTAGARIVLDGLPARIAAGGTWMFAPSTLWGAHASGGVCFGGTLAICGDVQLTAYFAGTGLANDETEVQLQLVLGAVARGGHR